MLKRLMFSSMMLAVSLYASIEVEPNGTFEKAQEIYNHDTVQATINQDRTDFDYYKFNVGGEAFNFTFDTTEENTNFSIYVYNQQHKQIHYYRVGKGERGFSITLGANSGTIYIKVVASNYSDHTKSYNITVGGLNPGEIIQRYEIQPNGSFENANRIVEGIYYNATIDTNAHDIDYFKFRNNSDTMRLVFRTNEENIDYYIYVYDQQHHQIKYFPLYKGELDLDETFGIAQGTVYVKVSASNYTDGFGEYEIAVNPNKQPPQPHCSTTDLRANIPYNDSLNRTCMSKIKDGSYAKYYQINLSSTETVDISLSSDSLDTYLSLMDMNGNVIASDDDGGNGTNSQLTLSLSAGSYIVEVTSYYEKSEGDFTLMYTTDIPISKYYGALAYDSYLGYWATGWRYSDLQSAKQSTLDTCGSSGCEIIATVSGDDCVALATGTNPANYEIAYGSTPYEAEANAEQVCDIFYSNCTIQTSVCADGR